MPGLLAPAYRPRAGEAASWPHQMDERSRDISGAQGIPRDLKIQPGLLMPKYPSVEDALTAALNSQDVAANHEAIAAAPAVAMATIWQPAYASATSQCLPLVGNGAWTGAHPAQDRIHSMSSVPMSRLSAPPMHIAQPVGVGTFNPAQMKFQSASATPPLAQLVMPMGQAPAVWPAAGAMPEATITGAFFRRSSDDVEEADDCRGAGSARKNAWSREEDEILARVVMEYGASKWTKVAAHLPGRMGKQCRERWFNHLAPDVKKGEWTEEEDRLIMAAVREHGTKWSVIVKQLPGRSDNAIKNRYYSAVRKANRQVASQDKRSDTGPIMAGMNASATSTSAAMASSRVQHAAGPDAVFTSQVDSSYLPMAQSVYTSPHAVNEPIQMVDSTADSIYNQHLQAQLVGVASNAHMCGYAGRDYRSESSVNDAYDRAIMGIAQGHTKAYPSDDYMEQGHLTKRQRYDHFCVDMITARTGRFDSHPGSTLSLDQETAALHVPTNDDMPAFAPVDRPIHDLSPAGAQSYVTEHDNAVNDGRQWTEDNLDIPEAVAVVCTPVTA